MWGKNADGIAFHYFESMADVNYVCGRRQKAASIQVDTVPKGVCADCAKYYLSLPPHRRPAKPKAAPGTAQQSGHDIQRKATVSRSAAPSNAPADSDQTTAVADKNIKETAQGNTEERINRYFGPTTPEHLATRDFEVDYLQSVLQTIQKQTSQNQSELDNLRQERRGLGNKQFSEGAIIAWKVENNERMLEVLESMTASPYFGRIDFLENPLASESPNKNSSKNPSKNPNESVSENQTENQTENGLTEMIFIGRSTLEGPGGAFLVYDWRAPICSMYYAYNLGQASYTAPMGTISGEIVLKRQYEIKHGKIASIYDSSGEAIARGEAVDEMLLSLLKRNSSGRMRQIVQSIQAEQDAIIRSGGDVVVVQGPAGSGKTIIALHRAAFLLYEMRLDRERQAQRYGNISASRMLVFSPNNVFADYISRVLPDLHEDQIRQVVLEQFLQGELNRQLRADAQAGRYTVESKADHYEIALGETAPQEARRRMVASAFKASPTMRAAIDLYLARQEVAIEEAFDDLELSIVGVVMVDPNQRIFYSKEDMVRHFRQASDANGVAGRIDTVLNRVRVEIADYGRIATVQTTTVRRLERERQRLADRLKPFKTRNLMDLYTALWQESALLTEAQNEVPFQPFSPLADSGENTGSGFVLSEIARDTLPELKRGRIAYEDLIPLLLVCGYYRGFPAGLRETDHAVVDEAQDYSVLHYEYIRRCLPNRCSLTIVGDINQAIDPALNLHSYDVLESIFPKRIKRLELTKSYRSSMEITRFAGRVLRGGANIDNVRRSGSKPKRIEVPAGERTDAAIGTALEELAHEEFNTIAILCKTRKEATALHARLQNQFQNRLLALRNGPAGKSYPEITLLTDGAASFANGIFVLPVPLAKGLEFDAVILQDAGATVYAQEEDRKFLYTACTRALHALYICHSGLLSPLLDADPTLSDLLSNQVE